MNRSIDEGTDPYIPVASFLGLNCKRTSRYVGLKWNLNLVMEPHWCMVNLKDNLKKHSHCKYSRSNSCRKKASVDHKINIFVINEVVQKEKRVKKTWLVYIVLIRCDILFLADRNICFVEESKYFGILTFLWDMHGLIQNRSTTKSVFI